MVRRHGEPDAILAGGRQGWPLIPSGLTSLLETGKPIAVSVKMGAPAEMLAAPWRVAG